MTTTATTVTLRERGQPGGPPSAEARKIAEVLDDHARFVVIRRGSFGMGLRWDACEFVVHPAVPDPRTPHQQEGRHACLARVGFGYTRRGALWHMMRCSDEALAL